MSNKTFIAHLQSLQSSNVVPKSFSTDLECVKFIMYFIHPHLDKRFGYYSPNCIFNSFYDKTLRDKQLICHYIRNQVNDGNIIDTLNHLEKHIKNDQN